MSDVNMVMMMVVVVVMMGSQWPQKQERQ